MMDTLIIRLYGSVIILIIVTAWYIRALVKKKRWIQWEKTSLDMRKTIRKHEKGINRFIRIFIGGGLAFLYVVRIIPAMIDIPNAIHKNYLYAEGEVVGWNLSRENSKKERAIAIIDSKTNEEISLTLYSYGIKKGEYIEVIYLPYSKYGVVKE